MGCLQKQLAWESGCARLFLLLVSMQPAARNRVACLLGWSTVLQKDFGDSHSEAWEIINANSTGMQACCNQTTETINLAGSNCNYYDMLYRAGMFGMPDCKPEMKKRFKRKEKKIIDEWCLNPDAAQLRMLEDMLIAKMAQMQRARMNAAQREAIDKMRATKSEQYLRAAAQMEHCVADDRVKNYAVRR